MRNAASYARILYRSLVRPVLELVGSVLSVVPALFAGAGVFFIVAGLFTYLQPANASTASASPSATIALATASPGYTVPPLVSTSPGPSQSAATTASVATRIRVPALSIDLPIVPSPPNEEFP